MAAARHLWPTTNEDHEYTNGAVAWAIRVFVAAFVVGRPRGVLFPEQRMSLTAGNHSFIRAPFVDGSGGFDMALLA